MSLDDELAKAKAEQTNGAIYILTNPAMPGIVKIGYTAVEVTTRMAELDRTPVPYPFSCFYAGYVENVQLQEQRIHTIFADRRCRPQREFFAVSPEQAKAAIELVAIRDVTPSLPEPNENVKPN
jgi:hypothetical protein